MLELSWSNASSLLSSNGHWVLVSGNSRLPSGDNHDSLQSWPTPPHPEPKSLKPFLPCAKMGRKARSGVIKKKMPLGTASQFPFRKIISLYNFLKWQNQLEKNNYPVKVSWPPWNMPLVSMKVQHGAARPACHPSSQCSSSFCVALLAFDCVQPCICPWARLLLVVFLERRLKCLLFPLH